MSITAATVLPTSRIARAWVNFSVDGLGVVTINDSYNVASVLRNATGDFTITFTEALTNGSYAVAGIVRKIGVSGGVLEQHDAPTRTTAAHRIYTGNMSANVTIDPEYCSVIYFDS